MVEPIKQGHGTTFTFGDYPEVVLEEKSVTPPGYTGGDPVDTTTMRNTEYKTSIPQQLKEGQDASGTVVYHISQLSNIMDMINDNQLITVTFSDSSTVAFWGWVADFVPNEVTPTEQPTATITIHQSLENESGVETAPVSG